MTILNMIELCCAVGLFVVCMLQLRENRFLWEVIAILGNKLLQEDSNNTKKERDTND